MSAYVYLLRNNHYAPERMVTGHYGNDGVEGRLAEILTRFPDQYAVAFDTIGTRHFHTVNGRFVPFDHVVAHESLWYHGIRYDIDGFYTGIVTLFLNRGTSTVMCGRSDEFTQRTGIWRGYSPEPLFDHRVRLPGDVIITGDAKKLARTAGKWNVIDDTGVYLCFEKEEDLLLWHLNV